MKKLITCVWAVLTALFIGSCERLDLNEFDDSETNNSENESFYGNAQLKIKTRGTSDTKESGDGATETTEKISYPICIYVFDRNSSKLADMLTIANKDEQVEFMLKKGTYDVYAVGLDQENLYVMPDKEKVTPNSPLTLSSGQEHGDLMTASATATLSENEEHKLTLQMVRKTMRLENVTIDKIPDDVTAVTVTLAPLGENVKVDGTIDGTSGTQVINLVKKEGTQTWQYTKKLYMLASGSNATIKVALTYKSGQTLAYSYASEEKFEANYKMSIHGEYAMDEVYMNGTLEGVGWKGTKDIQFQMQGGSIDLDRAPKAGDTYHDYYVLKSVTSDNCVTLTLMSIEEKTELVYTDNDNQESMSAAVNKGLKELSKNGITMRLPTKAERLLLRDNVTEVNNNLGKAGFTKLTVNAGEEDRTNGYFTKSQTTGKLTVFFLSDGKVANKDEDLEYSKSAGFRLRGFATVTISGKGS